LNERRQKQQKQIYDQNNRMNLPQLKCLEYESDSSFNPKEELKRHKNKADSTYGNILKIEKVYEYWKPLF
jgi:hypothetical protein